MDGTNVCTNNANKTTHSSTISDKRHNSVPSHLRRLRSKRALPKQRPTPRRHREPESRPPPRRQKAQMRPRLRSPHRQMTIQPPQPNQTHRKRTARPPRGRVPPGTPVTSGHQIPLSQTSCGEKQDSSRPFPKNNRPQSQETNPAPSLA